MEALPKDAPTDDRQLLRFNVVAFSVFIGLYLTFARATSGPEFGYRLYDVSMAAALAAIVAAVRAPGWRALQVATMALAVSDGCALYAFPAATFRWFLAWIFCLAFYATLRAWSDGARSRWNAGLLGLFTLVLGFHVLLLGAEAVLTLMMQSKDATRLPCLGHPGAQWKFSQLYGAELNSAGLRERELPERKKAGTRRFLVVGDSVTFGFGVPVDETLSRRLEGLLNQPPALAGMTSEVINAGWPGFDTPEERDFLVRRGNHYDPDVIVLIFFDNDIEGSSTHVNGEFEWLTPLYGNWMAFSMLSRTINQIAGALGLREKYIDHLATGYTDDTTYGRMQADLEAMAAWCATFHRKMVIVHLPLMVDLKAYPLAVAHDKMRATAARLRVPYLDLLPLFAGSDERSLQVNPVFDQHPNSEAHRRAAEAINGFLREQSWKGNPP